MGPFLARFRLFSTVFDRFQPFSNVFDHLIVRGRGGLIFFDGPKIIKRPEKKFHGGPTWSLFGPHGVIFARFRLFLTVFDRLRPFSSVFDHLIVRGRDGLNFF